MRHELKKAGIQQQDPSTASQQTTPFITKTQKLFSHNAKRSSKRLKENSMPLKTGGQGHSYESDYMVQGSPA